MKKFKVVLNEGHSVSANDIIDGCIGNVFGSGIVQLYDRSEAIKKAKMFNGKAKEVKGLNSVIGKLSMQTIPENAIIHDIVKELEGREAFKDADKDNTERIYHGDVFEAILCEYTEMIGTNREKPRKVIAFVTELADLITADYVLITNSYN